MPVTLYEGDCLAILPTLAENSIDSIVTDPPYHLTQLSRGGSPRVNDAATPFGRTRLADRGFMSLCWDGGNTAFQSDTWTTILRVLKPGGHLISFGGTRTYHHMAVAIEQAGFEFRDQISWNYGSGFPKNFNIATAIDKAVRGVPHGGSDPTSPNHGKFKSGCSAENPEGRGFGAGPGSFMVEAGEKIERELVPEAVAWQGWGTALKPAYEPIILARKPFQGTVADNVLRYGTGALNIDACRIPTTGRPLREVAPFRDDVIYHGNSLAGRVDGSLQSSKAVGDTDLGRWPANWIHDGSDEVMEAYAAYGEKTSGIPGIRRKPHDTHSMAGRLDMTGETEVGYADSGSAARFFYCAKATKADRFGSSHPTVKPISLMRYLCKLITPPGGIILDPFAGSGTTGQAAIDEGFDAMLIEREHQYCQDIRRRLVLFIEKDISK